jgi:rifampicin phosphotransferase
MGLELVRAGHDYRGRYTLPWEYFTESTRPAHVVEWQENNRRTYWSRLVDGLAGLIRQGSQSWPLALILVGLALLSRLIVLPVSLKAEQDQIVSRRIDPQVAALKQRFAEDPVRLRRAMKHLFDAQGLTPGRNMLGLLFLPLLAVSVVAIEQAASQMSAPFLWLASPAARDHLFILPLLFGAALALYLDSVFGKSPRQRAAIWLGGILIFGGMTAAMGSAANFYVVVSAALILLQRFALTTDWRRLAGRLSGARAAGSLPTLDQPDRLAASGNKALRLAQLRAAGAPVPDGVVLDGAALAAYAVGPQAHRDAVHADVWRALGGGKVAVRSSAAGEDGAEHSFAGVFDSVVDVDQSTLPDALARVIASFRNERAGAYGVQAAGSNILIQKMVDARYAGVLFTRSPGSGGEMMVEMVEGTADAFVSGAATPRTFRFGAATGKRLSEKEPPMDPAPLLAIGRKAEALFGAPQDIEWAFRDGAFQIVQSRDITQSAIGDARSAAIEEERARLLRSVRGAADDDIVLVRNGLSELLPRPTPLSLSLMEEIWSPGGSVDLACRSLDLEYRVGETSPPLLAPVFGRLYVDRRQEAARAPVVSRLNARRLLKQADELEQNLRGAVFDDIQARYAVFSVADFQRMPEDQLFAALKRAHAQFITETYAAVEAVNILSELFVLKAQEALRQADLDPGVHLAIAGDTFVSKVLAAAAAAPAPQRRDILLHNIGHRAAFDYELACPRHAEAPEDMERLTAGWAAAPAAPDDSAALSAKARGLVEKARRFQRLKEDAKHMAMKDVAILRRMALAVDASLGLGGDVFWLTFGELLEAAGGSARELSALAARRKAQAELFRSVPGLPAQLTAGWLESASLSSAGADSGDGSALRGARVAGSQAVEGRARVVPDDVAEAGGPIPDLAEGDIVVAEMIPHAWLPYFRTIGGVVSEVGGFLSHTAIVAREFDLSMIVGVAGWRSIRDGDRIRIEMDGGVSILDAGEERRERLAAAE